MTDTTSPLAVPGPHDLHDYDFQFAISRYPESYLTHPVWCIDATLIHRAFEDDDNEGTEEKVGSLDAVWLTEVQDRLDLLQRTDMISQSIHDLAGASPAEDDSGGLTYHGEANVHQWMGIGSMLIAPGHRGRRLGLLFMEHLLTLYGQTETLLVGKAHPVIEEPDVAWSASKHTTETLARYWKSLGFDHDPKTHIIHHHTNFVRRPQQ